jgi:uncharacterized coiled-coil DUF342 family protein
VFERIRNFFREIRIKADFPSYEEKCRLHHHKRAEKRFPTVQLEQEIKSIIKSINAEADVLFKIDTNKINDELAQMKIMVLEKENMLRFFIRDYKTELDKSYEMKSQLLAKKIDIHKKIEALRVDLSEVHDKKNKAFVTLNHYKTCIASWYSKSDRTPWLFGNSGKRLPNHALFGQSFGDLNSYKSSRDSTSDDIQKYKREIDAIKTNIASLGAVLGDIKEKVDATIQEIANIKISRDKMYELKKEGNSKLQLQSGLNELQSSIEQDNHKLGALESQRSEFVVMKKYQHGIDDLEKEIKFVEEVKLEFFAEFDLERIHKERIKEHRLIWLKERNLL